MRYVVVAALIAVLAGCVSPAEQERVHNDPWAFNPFGLFKKQATWNDVDDAKCKSYGATPGTDQYVQCRATLDQGHGAIEQQQQQNVINALGVAGQMQQNAQPQQPTQPSQPQWITPPPKNTWCRQVGQQISCTTQ